MSEFIDTIVLNAIRYCMATTSNRRGLSYQQLHALELISHAGPEGLPYYWYPPVGHNVLVNAHSARSLVRRRLIVSSWQIGIQTKLGAQSVRVAKLTSAGRDILQHHQCSHARAR